MIGRERQIDTPALTHAPCAGANLPLFSLSPRLTTLTHAPCAGANQFVTFDFGEIKITLTHAPCAGANTNAFRWLIAGLTLTHAPCAGANPIVEALQEANKTLTHAPCAGANKETGNDSHKVSDFNPRPLCGGERAYNKGDEDDMTL